MDPLPDLVLEAAVVVGGGKFSTSDILIFSEINQNIVVDFKHKCYAGYQALQFHNVSVIITVDIVTYSTLWHVLKKYIHFISLSPNFTNSRYHGLLVH